MIMMMVVMVMAMMTVCGDGGDDVGNAGDIAADDRGDADYDGGEKDADDADGDDGTAEDWREPHLHGLGKQNT